MIGNKESTMKVRTMKDIQSDNEKINIVGPVSEMGKLVYKTVALLAENKLPYDKTGVIAYLESSMRLNKSEKAEISEILDGMKV
jgi:hypothetical protein